MSLEKYKTLSPSQKELDIYFLLLHRLFNNPDAGEIYINSNGDIFSLDFGETNIGDRKLSFILTEISLSSGASVLSQYLCDKSISCERFVELERIILKRIVESTFEEYYKFISDVNLLFGNFIAKQYEDYIIQIKNICKKLLCAL